MISSGRCYSKRRWWSWGSNAFIQTCQERQHAVSRLLAEPHYLTPLEPPNAIGDAKANRQYELTLGLAEDCFLGARLLINDRSGQTRTTDPKRIELAKHVLARAMKLAPDNEAFHKLNELCPRLRIRSI